LRSISPAVGRDIETLSSGVHSGTQDMAIEWVGKSTLRWASNL